MEWKDLFKSMCCLSLSCTRLPLLYFGIGQSLTKTATHFTESSLAHSPFVLLSRMASFCLDLFQFLYPSFAVLYSFCLAAVLYVWPPSQSVDTVSIDWVQVGEFVGIAASLVIAISGWRKANSEARKTDADATLVITNAVNSAVNVLLPPLEARITSQTKEMEKQVVRIDDQGKEIARLNEKVHTLEKENAELKAENRVLTSMIVALGGHPLRKD